jgi:hypothetical protein
MLNKPDRNSRGMNHNIKKKVLESLKIQFSLECQRRLVRKSQSTKCKQTMSFEIKKKLMSYFRWDTRIKIITIKKKQ